MRTVEYGAFRRCFAYKTELTPEEISRKIIHEAKLWLDSGEIFGKAGAGFQRINVTAPRTVVEECMERLKKVFGS